MKGANVEGKREMDVTDELLLSLLGGVGQGTAKAATLGTTAAAAALWKNIRSQFRRRTGSLNAEEKGVLKAEPGDSVNTDVLRDLLQKLSDSELKYALTIYQPSVAGDWISEGGIKNVYNLTSDG